MIRKVSAENRKRPRDSSVIDRSNTIIDDNTPLSELLHTEMAFNAFKEGIFGYVQFYEERWNFDAEMKAAMRNKLSDIFLKERMFSDPFRSGLLRFPYPFNRFNRNETLTTQGQEKFYRSTTNEVIKYLTSPACHDKKTLVKQSMLYKFETVSLHKNLEKIRIGAWVSCGDFNWFPTTCVRVPDLVIKARVLNGLGFSVPLVNSQQNEGSSRKRSRASRFFRDDQHNSTPPPEQKRLQ
jgi:hypothetical protein